MQVVRIRSLPLEGSVAEAPPAAYTARRRRLAKRAEQAERSTATIEPDGIGGAQRRMRCLALYIFHPLTPHPSPSSTDSPQVSADLFEDMSF